MSAKARDGQGRWRSQTIGVRVSPEENAEINALVALSGMTKQDYVIHRLQDREITVMGNPRVYKTLKNQMEQLYLEIKQLCDASQITPEMWSVLQYMAAVYDGMKNENSTIKMEKERK